MTDVARRVVVGVLAALLSAAGSAATLDVVGVFPDKAVVTVDGGSPRSVSVGESVAGFKLVAVDGAGATFVVDGKRQRIAMGSYLARPNGHDRASAVLSADDRGHYVAQGFVNGTSTRFLVDTGATMVVLSVAEANRLGLRFREAPLSMATTANGTVPYRVMKLDRIKVGDVELTNVDAGVIEGSYDGPNLLGMSFLSRTEVTRDGDSMVLTRRF